MKNFKKLSTLFFLSVIMLSASLVSCSDDDDDVVGKLTFDIDKVELPVGEVTKVKIKDGEAPYKVEIKTAEKLAMKEAAEGEKPQAIIEVKEENKEITITAVSKGKATIVVTDSKHNTGTISVVVKDEGIDFDKKEVTVKVDAEQVITIIGGVAPYEVAKIEKEEVASATIKEDKLTVKGLKAGTTKIEITGKDKKNIGTVTVTVE